MPERTLGECSAVELIQSARSEIAGLSDLLNELEGTRDQKLVIGAYLGSIGARLIVAENKIKEEDR